MKPTTPLFAVLMLLAGACRQDAGREAAEPAPKTAEEYTLAIIKEVQKVILSTDQQLREYQPQRLEFPAGEGQEARTLQLWTEEGNPVRLSAATPQAYSTFYFANGELFFATQPGAHFIFIGPELKYWLDEEWKPQPAPEQAREEREQELLEQAERYLRLFDMQ